MVDTKAMGFTNGWEQEPLWRKSSNRVDVGDYSPSTSHCTVRTGLVYGATYI